MFKTLFMPALLFLTAVTQLPSSTAAQYDDLLIVEKRKDLAARTRLLRELRKTVVTVNFEDASVADVIKYLQVVTGEKVNFILIGKSEDVPKVNLQLKAVRLPSLMSLIEEQTEFRFTFRGGLVLLKPKDKVKEFTYLKMYDVRVAVMPVRSFKPPRIGIGLGEVEEAEEEEEPQPLLFSSDQLVDLIRTHAVADTWDKEGVSLDVSRGILLVKQSVRGHRVVQEMLVKFGAISPIRRIVRTRGFRTKPKTQKPKPTPKTEKSKAKKKATH